MRPFIVLLALLVVVPVVASAQEWGRRGRRGPAPSVDPAPDYDGRLTFVRIRFDPRNMFNWSDGMPAWGHDYPTAERNFMAIMEEITLSRVYAGGSKILTFDDPDLFRYPIAYVSEPGDLTLSADEAEGLRTYLAKGGFVIFDDFPARGWRYFENEMRKVIPDVEYVRLSLDHPVFRSFFDIDSLDDFRTSYRGGSAFLGIFEDNDTSKRLMAVVNLNMDIGEYWQHSATGFVPVDESNHAFKLGVNYWLYALTH